MLEDTINYVSIVVIRIMKIILIAKNRNHFNIFLLDEGFSLS